VGADASLGLKTLAEEALQQVRERFDEGLAHGRLLEVNRLLAMASNSGTADKYQ
jgi:hypothetical protein